MGYCFSVSKEQFSIAEAAQKPAIKALRDAYPDAKGMSLEDFCEHERWHLNFDDEHDDVVGIEFWGEKLWNDFALFKALAPFVDAGSYIECNGEEGEMWRWVFDGATCTEVRPTVTWPPLPLGEVVTEVAAKGG